jgi:multidrug efflux pump subunit AcrA (membrane-fusion protein)
LAQLSKAAIATQETLLEIETHRRDELTQQLKSCRVTAPEDGVVVYSPDTPRLRVGSMVRKQQVVLILQRGSDDH